jgi:hypothetical protein
MADLDLLPAHDQVGPSPAPVAQPDVAEPEAVKQLRALFAKGAPKPADVLAILDAHRADRAAIFAFLHHNAGNAFVAQVMAEADKWRLSKKELAYGDPSDPTDGYFLASAAEKQARWRTADGDFTGTVDKQGIDSRLATGEHTSLHLQGDFDRKSGSLGLERDGKVLGEVAGNYVDKDNWQVGLRRPFQLDGGATLTPELRHQVRPEFGAADVAALGYKKGDDTTVDGYLGRHESGGLAAGIAGHHRTDAGSTVDGKLDYTPELTRGSLAYRSKQLDLTGNLTHRDPAGGDASTAVGLGATYRPNDKLTLGANAGHDRTATDDSTTLGLTGNYNPTDRLSMSAGATHTARRIGDDETALRFSSQYKPTDQLTLGAHANHTERKTGDDETIYGVNADYRPSDKLSLSGFATETQRRLGDDERTLGLSGTYKPDQATTIGSNITYTDRRLGDDETSFRLSGDRKFSDQLSLGGNLLLTERKTGDDEAVISASGTYTPNNRLSLTGNASHTARRLGDDETVVGLSGTYKQDDRFSLTGGLSHTERRHGEDLTTLNLGSSYNTSKFVGATDLSYSTGGERDVLRANASGDLQLAPKWYAGAFGSVEKGVADKPTGSVGASLTFTPEEKVGLTLAGIVDEQGNLETRLQLDLFKKRIESVAALSANKKEALVSLFVSYTQGNRFDLLDDRYGSAQYGFRDKAGGDNGMIGAGIRIRF